MAKKTTKSKTKSAEKVKSTGSLSYTLEAEQIISIWEKRLKNPSEFGGNIYDFIAHAESELRPIINNLKYGESIRNKARDLNERIKQLDKSKEEEKTKSKLIQAFEKEKQAKKASGTSDVNIEKRSQELKEQLNKISKDLSAQKEIKTKLKKELDEKDDKRDEIIKEVVKLLHNEKFDFAKISELTKKADELDVAIGKLKPALNNAEKKINSLNKEVKELGKKAKLASSLIKKRSKSEAKIKKKSQKLLDSEAESYDKARIIPISEVSKLINSDGVDQLQKD